MTAKSKNNPIGSSFEDFLKEDGIYEEVTQSAIKSVLARQIESSMHSCIGHPNHPNNKHDL